MAKKAKSTLINMLLSLTAIALVAAAILAALNSVTQEPIAAAQNAISAVLPAFAKLDDQEVDGKTCHVAYDEQGNMVGAAIEAGNDKGFGGHLQLMVGFDADGLVTGYQILETHETPGLGAKADAWFQKDGKGSVIGSKPADGDLVVKKDGGSVDAITGSTITSRAFLSIVNDAAKTFSNITR